jgi:hypothetical protein
LDNTIARVIYGLCGHVKNSVGGFTAVMVGAGISNLIGFIFILNLNLELNAKKKLDLVKKQVEKVVRATEVYKVDPKNNINSDKL